MAEENPQDNEGTTAQGAGRRGGERTSEVGRKVKDLVEEGKEPEAGHKGGQSFGGPHKRAATNDQHARAKSHKTR